MNDNKKMLIGRALQLNTDLLELQEKAAKVSAMQLRPILQDIGKKQLEFNAIVMRALTDG